VIGGWPASSPNVVAGGGTTLYTDGGGNYQFERAWRGSTELQLSPKEFALLELFLRHAGTVLTRSQILDAAWDFAYDGTSNVVDQYVGYLRRKLDRAFGHDDFETVRGVGYRLRAADGG